MLTSFPFIFNEGLPVLDGCSEFGKVLVLPLTILEGVRSFEFMLLGANLFKVPNVISLVSVFPPKGSPTSLPNPCLSTLCVLELKILLGVVAKISEDVILALAPLNGDSLEGGLPKASGAC